MYYFTKAYAQRQYLYPPVPSGSLPDHKSLSWKDGRVGAATTFGLHESYPRVIGEAEVRHRCLQHCRTEATSYTHRPRSSFSIVSRTGKWKARTKGPMATPSQVSWSIGGPYVPPMEARSVLGSRRRKLAPRGKNEAKNQIGRASCRERVCLYV